MKMSSDTYHFDGNKISRRSVLRGLGATLALPWLPSLAWAEQKAAATAGLTGPPRRWGMLLFANGVHPSNWWAKGAGANMEISSVLQPLAPYREDLLFLNNLNVYGNTSPGHWPMFTNFLSGAELTSTPVPNAAVSVDQFMAQRIGSQTPVPSLTMGCEPASYGSGGGAPSIYWTTMSWTSPTTPVAPEIFPAQIFDRLFDVTRLKQHASVLDSVLQQSKSLGTKLDYHDRQKLDEFMTSVRGVEARLQRAASDQRLEGWQPTLQKPNMKRPSDELPQDVREHMQIMIDLMVLAFQMDKTRIATLLLNRDTSKMKFGFLEGVGNMPMHAISHHGNKEDHIERYRLMNQYHVEMAAGMVQKMKGIDEGNGSLLDNTMLLFGSNMMDGHIHDGRKCPIAVIGGKNCDIQPGRVLDFQGEEQTKLCNLHLAFLQRMGVPAKQFGNSTMPLPELV